jgi:predicted permease
MRGFTEEATKRYLDRRLELLPGGRGRSDLRGDAGRALFAVLGLVGLLLALACANLANLFASRATRHERELTVRLALGARRGDLVRRILVEAFLLAAVAAGLGLALVAVLGRVLPARLADQPGAIVPESSPLLVGWAIALALVAALGSGLLPALALTRGGIAERLRSSAASALGGLRGARTRRVLVGVQVALSAPILIGAGLAVRSLDTLTRRHPGLETAGVVMFRVDPRLTGLSLEAESELVDRLERELAALPGVTGVARGEITLLENSVRTSSLEIVGRETDPESGVASRFDTVSTGYFETLGIPIRRGRGFSEADRRGSTQVVVVSEKFARDHFPGEDPIGRRFRWGGDDVESEIVGVAGDVLTGNQRETEAAFAWVPWAQAHDGSATTFYVRAAGSPEALAPTLRRRVAEVAPGLPVVELRTLAAQARRSLRVERITASLASGLGILAALLAAIGLYGVLAYAVDARRRELALRAALGAAPGELGRWVLGHAAAPVAAGLAIGVAAAFGASGVLEKLLFGIAPRDPATFAAVVGGLLAVALAAALVPARRALAIEPAAALREE